MTAKIRSESASRYIDSERGACAIRIAGCSPIDLIQHEPEELARDEAEEARLAYVAATRARDLLIVPAVGDEEREGWIDPINRAIYPADDVRRQQVAAPGCPAFKSKDTVLMRPNGVSAGASTVCPGATYLRARRYGGQAHDLYATACGEAVLHCLMGSAQPEAQGRAAARDSPFRAHRQGCGAADCRGRSG